MTAPVLPVDAATRSDLAEDVWAAHRGRAQGLAYRMLGSVADADDVIQEAYLRLRRTDLATIDRPAAWLMRVVSRLCLDELGPHVAGERST